MEKGNLGEPRPKQCDLLEASYGPSHHFPPNLLGASCLCKRFVVCDISALFLESRGVWQPHLSASLRSSFGSAISLTWNRNLNQRGKGQPITCMLTGWTRIHASQQLMKDKENAVSGKANFLLLLSVHISLVLPHKHGFLSPTQATVLTRQVHSVWDAVNIFRALTAPEGWCSSCPWHLHSTLRK